MYDLNHLPTKDELKKCCKELQNHLTDKGVSDIDGNELYNEQLHVESILDVKKKPTSPIQILKLIRSTDRKDLFRNLWIALRILLTILVTVASAERSFSKFKLIKTYLRSSMTEKRLNALAILSIENEEAKKLDFKYILTSFANAKARKIPLSI